MTHTCCPRGFTLIETLIATSLLVTAIAGLAHLFASSARFTRDADQFGVTLAAAQDKLETLRALRFAYDEGGGIVTDSRLTASPADSLSEDRAEYADWLDGSGAVLPGADGADYVRRWRITAMAADGPEAIAIDVCVFSLPSANPGDPREADACLSTVRVRQP
jgi:prepilin-type N-terminal cleavage/methylation domain-containing protein